MTPSIQEPDRLQVLSRRVGWLDRWRRPIAVVLGVYACVTVFRDIDGVFGPTHFISGGFSLFSGAAAWWLVEVVMAWMAAFWETEHDRIVDTRGLPRAHLLAPRHKRRLFGLLRK